MLLEIRVEVYANGKWTYLPPPQEFLEGEIVKYLAHIPIYPDWFTNCGFKSSDAKAVLANSRNFDRFATMRANWTIPPDCTTEIREIIDGSFDSRFWMLLSDLHAYDWERAVSKYARTISAEETKRRSITPNLPDGCFRELQSHETRDWRSRGYDEIEIATRECVPELLVVLERIAAAAQTEPQLIRIYIWDL
jgi:hypothetical protein